MGGIFGGEHIVTKSTNRRTTDGQTNAQLLMKGQFVVRCPTLLHFVVMVSDYPNRVFITF